MTKMRVGKKTEDKNGEQEKEKKMIKNDKKRNMRMGRKRECD
jgi:hypothetical protein